MSSRSRRERAKFEHVPATDPQTMTMDEWVPDYGRQCELCGETPCVTGVAGGRVVYEGSLCGAHTWGEARLLDPANW